MSPTGYLHIGGIRTALFNYLFAKKHGGEFLLRIEDTDQARFVEGAEKYIIDTLNWCGIPPDNSINPDGTVKYKQSQREYQSYAETLINSGHAYYAFDSTEELEAMRGALKAAQSPNIGYNSITRVNMKNSFTLSADEVKNLLDSGASYVIRFNMPVDESIVVSDSVKGTATFDSKQLDDKILFKSDGLPTYHLANVVDDHLMEITHVIRADEWFSSTPLHLMLYKAFGWDAPEFCHLPLVLGPDGQKISKRKLAKYGFPILPFACDFQDDKGVTIHAQGFKEEGYEPEALINFIALVGWNPGENKELMSMDEMISIFDLNRVNNSGAIFDIVKLNDFNARYVRCMNVSYAFTEYISPNIPDGKLPAVAPAKWPDVVNIAVERTVFAKDMYKHVSYFFEPVVLKDDVTLKNSIEFCKTIEAFVNLNFTDKEWTRDEIHSCLEVLCNAYKIKLGKIMPDLRMALTGGAPGPDLALTMYILGQEESKNRINNLLIKTKKVVE